MSLFYQSKIESIHPDVYADILVDSGLEMKGPRIADLPKHCFHGEHGRVVYSHDVAELTFLEANKHEVLCQWDLSNNGSAALINKMRPHCLYDLLLIDSSQTPTSGFSLQSEETLAKYWHIIYKMILLMSNKNRLLRYGMNPYFTHITYNVDSDILDRESSTSDSRFHIHFNTFFKDELVRVKSTRLESVLDAGTRISLVDPALLIGISIIRDALNGLFTEEIVDSGFDSFKVLKQKLPLGFIFNLVGGWEILKSKKFSRFLIDVHSRLSKAFEDLRFALHGTVIPPVAWQRHPLLPIDEITHNLKRLHWLSPHSLPPLLSLIVKLKNLSVDTINNLKEHPDMLERHLSIAGLSYSVSFISLSLSSPSSPLLSSPNVIGYIQPKIFCAFGGAGQPFIPGTQVVQLKKCSTPYTEDEYLKRRSFQREIAYELMQQL